MQHSEIEWCDATWNPTRGCSRVSEGCRNCYAERVAARFSGPGQPYEGLVSVVKRRQFQVDSATMEPTGKFRTVEQARWNGTLKFVGNHLADPIKWRKPKRIFVNSMSDLFHAAVSDEHIAAVFGVMAACPQHTFIILTKRSKRMREWFAWIANQPTGLSTIRKSPRLVSRLEADKILNPGNIGRPLGTESQPHQWPLPNVWIGVSVENQPAADERIPDLLATPAALRLLSCEPLLDEVDLHAIQIPDEDRGLRFSALQHQHDDRYGQSDRVIDWVIAGCESGPGARRCEVEWLRSLRDQCGSASVPFFLKQAHFGPGIGMVPGTKRAKGGIYKLPSLDGKQHDSFPGG